MCGIVGYFGDAGNNLTRILTAISAITYRAPDSTGVGLFGDDAEPLRTRRCLGAIAPLVETLLEEPAYPNASELLFHMWSGADGDTSAAQRRLFLFEGLPTDILESLEKGEQTYKTYENLVDLDNPLRIPPGLPGRPGALPLVRIRSRRHLQRTLQTLSEDYDLSPAVVRTLFRRTLSEVLAADRGKGLLPAEPSEIMGAFDRLFDTASFEERSPRPRRIYSGDQPGTPYAEKYLWKYLVNLRIPISQDFDRDGVRCLFRLLDAALLSRLPCVPGLHEAVQETLEAMWPEAAKAGEFGGWRTLYHAEKGVNVYGRAGAAVLAYLRGRENPPLSSAVRSSSDGGSRHGDRTDPAFLRFLSSPLLSQGRWALQAPVTLKNAHPFFDARRQRVIVLNGQFSGDVEEKLGKFLGKVAGYRFRSGNSSEFFALLWGYYFDVLRGEKGRYEAVLSQVDQHLEEFGIGSRSIDYEVHRRLNKKDPVDLDALAFIEAARCISQGGGQIAAAGMGLTSPGCLYVASHNRPVFIVQRSGSQDFMVVSDINAAMGLFPQCVIREKVLGLNSLWKEHQANLTAIRADSGSRAKLLAEKKRYESQEKGILETFRVRIHPLEGEETFARLQSFPTDRGPVRTLTISDFEGNPMSSVESFETLLNPFQTGKDLEKSFYELHLEEIPERFENILQFRLQENETVPDFDIRESILRRRFGKNLSSLERILLLGMGSSHHAGIMARRFIQKALPGMEVVSLRPAEVEDITRVVIPEKDLALLLSWSGTTADMVAAAKDLQAMNAAIIGVTEKVFSDMGLIASRSVGVLPALSGEEVTIPGLKSVLCMLFNVSLFALWLSSKIFPQADRTPLTEGLQALPGLLAEVFQDREILNFSKTLAAESARSRSAVIVDAMYTTGTGREAAFKLEETSWNAVGRCLDYREVSAGSMGADPLKDLVIVNATNEARLQEALGIMEGLKARKIPFAAVGFTGRHQAMMEEACGGRLALLPKVDDELQPFVDLMFYYRFAFLYGLAHGRSAEDFPRNRAKSVTAGRSVVRKGRTPAAEITAMAASCAGPLEGGADKPGLDRESLWESEAGEKEKAYYGGMRFLAMTMREGSGPESFFKTFSMSMDRLSKALFDQVPDDGDMLLVPLDRAAHNTARTLSTHWSRLLGCTPRVTVPEDLRAHFPGDTVAFFLAADAPSPALLAPVLEKASSSCFFCGPSLHKDAAAVFESGLGAALLRDDFKNCEEEALFASLFSLFASLWKLKDPWRSSTVEEHFRRCGPAVGAVLNCEALRRGIAEAMRDNRNYSTAFLIAPPGGTGPSFAHRFERNGSLFLESYLFGESVHGPLVTVDPRIEHKFVRLERRRHMVSAYGEARVSAWETSFLSGGTVDDFLSTPPDDIPLHAKSPFYAEGAWYLPVLKPGYDPVNDNLIIMDASSERFLDRVLDEMATFGCRYARTILISQDALESRPAWKNIYKYPISHTLCLPGLDVSGGLDPLPEISLPLALNLLAAAMAAESSKWRDS